MTEIASDCGESRPDGDETQVESLGKIKQRHGQEKKELKLRCAALLKNAGKDKKQVKAQVKEMETEMANRHAKEIDDRTRLNEADVPAEEPAVSAVKGPFKKQRQLERRQAAEAEKKRQLDEELRDVVDHRQIESEKLESKLSPLNLTTMDIRPDGHCLYHAISHQLKVNGVSVPEPGHLHLRNQAAGYIRSHADEFRPFLLTNAGELMTSDQFEQHCDRIASATEALWGGQPEISALASVYRCRIIVYSADADPIVMTGEEASDDSMTLRLSFHKHILMGSHYNSVVSI